jgi:hypothetical protein
MAKRVVQRAAAPQQPIGIRAVIEEPMHAIIVMPVELSGEHQANRVLCKLAALDQDMYSAIVERLRSMIGDLAVIRIRAAIE